MLKSSTLGSTAGFTLIEVMIVIVVMGILASLVLLNIDGIAQRQAMQSRENFLLYLDQVRREANDQALTLAVNFEQQRYQVFYYDAKQRSQLNPLQVWQPYTALAPQVLHEDLRLNIDVIADQPQLAQMPKLIWFGNGEAQPARLQFYREEQILGPEVELNALGKIDVQ